jgi:hypothetical protein
MTASLETLRKMIDLEVEGHYENKAVIGGLAGGQNRHGSSAPSLSSAP